MEVRRQRGRQRQVTRGTGEQAAARGARVAKVELAEVTHGVLVRAESDCAHRKEEDEVTLTIDKDAGEKHCFLYCLFLCMHDSHIAETLGSNSVFCVW